MTARTALTLVALWLAVSGLWMLDDVRHALTRAPLASVEHAASDDATDVRPLLGPGYSDSFHVSCGTTATKIQSPTRSQVAYECKIDDAAAADVFIGDAAVTTSTYGDAVGAGEYVGGNVRSEYCIVASGTIIAHCRALVTREP